MSWRPVAPVRLRTCGFCSSVQQWWPAVELMGLSIANKLQALSQILAEALVALLSY